MIKQAGTFAAVAHSPKLAWTADATDEGAAEQALKIERDVGAERLRSL